MAGAVHYGSDPILDGIIGLHQILPSQYYDFSGGHRLTGEQRLMLALLADAINVYQQGALSRSTRKRMLYVDSERWIMSDCCSRHAFSFETVCECLGINPVVLRRRMITWKHEMRRGVSLPKPTHHLRLKITPRAKSMSQQRRRLRRGVAG